MLSAGAVHAQAVDVERRPLDDALAGTPPSPEPVDEATLLEDWELEQAVWTAEPPPGCVLPRDEEFIGLDWTRRATYEGLCITAVWLDSLFGEDRFDLHDHPIEGFVAANAERRKGESLEIKPKLRLRVRLPNLSKKLDLFFERDDENQTIVGETDSAATRQLGPAGQDNPQVGFGYEFMRGVDSLLNFRLGLRLIGGKADPFVRSRYTLTFAEQARSQWRFGQSLFWRHLEGFGETTNLDYENRIGGPFIFRWSNSATVSQTSDAFRWGSGVSILHPLDERQTLLYSYSAGGETGAPERVNNFGPRLSFRSRLHRAWLFGEVYIGMDRQKADPAAIRSKTTYLGLKIEAHFKTQ